MRPSIVSPSRASARSAASWASSTATSSSTSNSPSWTSLPVARLTLRTVPGSSLRSVIERSARTVPIAVVVRA